MLFSKIDQMPKKGCIFGVALNNLETYVENVVQTVIFTKSPKNKDDDSTPPCRKPNILLTHSLLVRIANFILMSFRSRYVANITLT